LEKSAQENGRRHEGENLEDAGGRVSNHGNKHPLADDAKLMRKACGVSANVLERKRERRRKERKG